MPFARDNASRDNLIRYYFNQLYTAKDVKDILSNIHHIQLSEKHLKRIKKRLNLQRTAFGIAINGAIDGFSRKVLWLKAGNTNYNPRYIAGLYLDFIKRYHRLPRVIRADGGSENVTTKLLQMAFRYNHNDRQSGTNSFITGRSTSNQELNVYGVALALGAFNFGGICSDTCEIMEFCEKQTQFILKA
ncbi:unnamed protein product [Mytilus coruscus]|uniref:Integrase core domain-containing protein n=1 Tax=Mytilus coruscus TaxID=42192 RepID=A0A6J8BPP8_MYTCO|nr:unnamed protein product [Mytilus coruscus]